MRRGTRTNLVFGLGALLLLAVVVGVYSIARIRRFTAHLDRVLAPQIRAQLGRDVSIESASAGLGGRATIRNLRIANGSSFRKGILFDVPSATVQFSVAQLLLSRGDVASSIRSIALAGPRLNLMRDRRGAWNVEDILRPKPGAPPSRFRAIVRVTGGRITVTDYAAGFTRRPAVSVVSEAAVTVDARRLPVTSFTFAGIGPRGRLASVHLEGTQNAATAVLDARLSVADADLAYWASYLRVSKRVQLTSGRADANLSLRMVRGRLDLGSLAGVARVRGVAARILQLSAPVQIDGGILSMARQSGRFTAAGRCLGSPATVVGTIAGVRTPILHATIRLPTVNASAVLAAIRTTSLSRDLSVAGPISVIAEVQGRATDLTVRAQARLPGATFRGVRARGIAAAATYHRGVLTVSSLAGQVAGGTVSASGAARLGRTPIPFSADGRFAGVELAQLRPVLKRNLGGRATGTFSVRGAGRIASASVSAAAPNGNVSWVRFLGGRLSARTADGVHWSGSAAASSVKTPRATLSAVSATGTYSDGRLQVVSARAAGWQGTFTASGTVRTNGSLSLDLAGNHVSLGAMMVGLGQGSGYSGTASLVGQVRGTVWDPTFSGRVAVRRGAFRGTEFDLLSGRILFAGNRLTVEDAELRRDNALVALSGNVSFGRAGASSLDITATAKAWPISAAAALLNAEAAVPGLVDAQLHITGQPGELEVSGDAVLSRMRIRGVRIDEARAHLVRLPEGATQFTDVSVRGPGFELAGGGTMSEGGDLNLSLRGDQVQLARLNTALAPYAAISGAAAVDVTIRGPVGGPDLNATISAAPVAINEVQFTSVGASVDWADGVLTVRRAMLVRDGAVAYVRQAQVNPAAMWVDASGSVSRFDVGVVQSLLRNSEAYRAGRLESVRSALEGLPGPIVGTLGVTFRVTGPVDRLSGAANVDIEGPAVGVASLSSLTGRVEWSPAEVRITNLTAAAPDVNLVADATIPSHGTATLSATVRQTEVQPLIHLLQAASMLAPPRLRPRIQRVASRIPEPTTGSIEGTVQLVGLGGNVSGTAGFVAAPLVIRGERLDRMDGQFTFGGNKVYIDQFSAAGEQMRVRASGSTGFAGELNLDVEASNVNLAVVGPALGVTGPIAGMADISLTARGTTENPALRASISASNVRIGDFAARLISAPGLMVQGDTLRLGEAVMAGETYQTTLTGTLPFSWSPIGVPRERPINVTASLAKQDLSILPTLTSEIKSIQGVASGAVTITGTLNHPVPSGSLQATVDSLALTRARNTFQDIRAIVTLEENRAVLSTLEGRSDLGGAFTGSGWVSLATLDMPAFQLQLDASDLHISLSNASGIYGEVVRAAANAHLVVAREQGGRPSVQGEVTLYNGLLSLPSQPPKVVAAAAPALPDITLGTSTQTEPLRVRVARNFQIARGGLRAMVTDEVDILGTLSQPRINGSLTFESGTVRMATQRFRIVPGGTVTIIYMPPRESRVILDMQAQTNIYAYSTFTGESENYTVFIDLTGPMDNPRVSFSSEPPGLSRTQFLALVGRQAEIEAILRGQDANRLLRQQLGLAFTGALVPELTSPIEQAVAQALGLEEFAIFYDFGTEPLVQLTRHLFGHIYLTYRRSLGGPLIEYLVKISYRLQRRLSLNYSIDERHTRTLAIEGRVQF